MKYPISIIFSGILVASSATAHHSDAGLDMKSLQTIEGTITEYSWRNPHVYIVVEAPDDSGEMAQWELQTSSTITLSRTGWTRESLSVGDQVSAAFNPALNGRTYGLLNSVTLADGTRLGSSFYSASSEPKLETVESRARAKSLEGKWLADGDKLVDYPGGFDGFFRAQLVLTEKAKQAQAEYAELSVENPESTCVGRPTPGMILSTVIYPLEIKFQQDPQIITLYSEFFDDLRTVYMDGRQHPDQGTRFDTGHSTGRWENGVLVVDTRNFADHRSPYQVGVPSGAQKHVVERFRLIEDGSRAVVEFILDDPEYLVEPLYHSRELIYSPQMELSPFDCDTRSTSRFVSD